MPMAEPVYPDKRLETEPQANPWTLGLNVVNFALFGEMYLRPVASARNMSQVRCWFCEGRTLINPCKMKSIDYCTYPRLRHN